MNASGALETNSSRRRAFRHALSLVLEHGAAVHDVEWSLTFQVAESERIAALAWHRKRDLICFSAPATVINRWRAHAMRVALQVEGLIAAVASAIAALKSAGVDPVVLKGPTLAQRLYGDAAVRPLADCDLFVPLQQRYAASEALFAAGWTSRIGEPPGEETFERWDGGQRNVIEVHSRVIDDPVLGHLKIPVEQTNIDIGSWSLPAQTGDYLVASLAAHLAKHETVPLLWIVDYYTLWHSLNDEERSAARSAARRAGLIRHLEWALRLANDLPSTVAGGEAALERLTALQRATGDLGRVRRLLLLSGSSLDAVRVLTGRLWPAEWRDSWARLPHYVLRRGAGWIARKTGLATPRTAKSSAARALPVDEAGLAALLEETLGRGLALWIRPRGTSMEPAIPPAAQAHIVPISSRTVRPGDVVLARLRHGQFVLHRVQRIAGDQVQLKGDAMRRRDDIVPASAIIGICDQVEIEGAVYRIEDRPRDNVALLASAAGRRLRRMLARGA
jgi:hypothetical protein